MNLISMKSKSMMDFSNYHEDVICSILLRLPVESLLRLRCVSKSWFSLISDPNFTKLRFDQTHTQQLILSLRFPNSGTTEYQYIDLEDSVKPRHVNVVFQTPRFLDKFVRICVLGVCRGFILLGCCTELHEYTWPPPIFLAWNLTTRVHKIISYPRVHKAQMFRRVRFGFEYDEVADDYFILIVWFQHVHRDIICVKYFELFSMRTNSWKRVDIHILYPKLRDKPNFVFVNGAIHWLALDDYGKSIKAIVAFDFIGRKVCEIALPDDGFVNKVRLLTLRVIEGCLCLLYGPERPGFAELWMMKKYKVNSSWTKFNYVPTSTVLPWNMRFSPIYFTKRGQIVGSDLHLKKLVILDDKGELLFNGDSIKYPVHINTESLCSLPSDCVQALEDNQQASKDNQQESWPQTMSRWFQVSTVI